MTPVSLTTLLLHSDGEKAFIGRLDLAKAFDHVHPAHVCCLFRHLVILPEVVKLFGGLGLEPAVFLYLFTPQTWSLGSCGRSHGSCGCSAPQPGVVYGMGADSIIPTPKRISSNTRCNLLVTTSRTLLVLLDERVQDVGILGRMYQRAETQPSILPWSSGCPTLVQEC